MKNSASGPAVRLAFLLCGMLWWCGQACALDLKPLPSDAAALTCLEQPEQALKIPSQQDEPKPSAFIRIRLTFSQPDQAPAVEILASTAPEAMRDLVLDHVRKYRLPCLLPSQEQVHAVQEFYAGPQETDNRVYAELSMPRSRRDCIVMPPKAPEGFSSIGRQADYVVLAGVFSGDASAEPTIRQIYSTGQRDLEELAFNHVRQYRMTCREAGEPAYLFTQAFYFFPAAADRYGFKRRTLGLAEFLGMVKGRSTLTADFDFITMSCPFDVVFTIEPPGVSNEVVEIGKSDPNRVRFLRWLDQLRLEFASPTQERALYGQHVVIQVPCARLKLGE